MESVPVQVKELSDAEAMELMVVLNKGRGEINYFKLSKLLNQYYERYSHDGLNQEELAGRFGYSRSTIADILPIFPRLKMCRCADTFSNTQLSALARTKNDKFRELLVERIKERDWSRKTIRKRAIGFNELTDLLNEELKDGKEEIIDELIQDLGDSIFGYDANALKNEAELLIQEKKEEKEASGEGREETTEEKDEAGNETEEEPRGESEKTAEDTGESKEEKSSGAEEERSGSSGRDESKAKQTPDLNGEVICGDIFEVVGEIEGEVKCVLTDPPYGISNARVHELEGRKDVSRDAGEWDHFQEGEYLEFTERWIDEIASLINEGGSVLIFTSDVYLSFTIHILQEKGFRDRKTIVWHKTNPTPSVDQDNFVSSVEYIVYATKGKPQTFNWLGQTKSHNFLECAVANETDHPTEKPVPLLEKLLKFVTNPGDTVLDPFLGSGSVALACENLDRRWIGVEKEGQFAEMAKKRAREEVEASG